MGSWVFNAYALQDLAAGALCIAGGLFVVVRERGSFVAVMYGATCFLAAVRLWGLAAAFSSATALQAAPMLQVSEATVALLPSTLFPIALSLAHPRRAVWWLLLPIGALSAALASATLFSEAALGPPYYYAWGYYSHYRWLGMLNAIFFWAVFSTATYLFWRKQRSASATPLERKRAQILFNGFAIAFLAGVDFLPALGIAIYPFGYMPVLVLVALAGYTTLYYQLSSVTAGLAARQIIDTLHDYLIVLDEEGAVRVLNPRAHTLLTGAGGGEPYGQPLGKLLPALGFDHHRTGRSAPSAYDSGEVTLLDADGKRLDLSVSVSVKRGPRRDAGIYVYLLHDITQRKEAERHLDYLANHDSLTGLPNRYCLQQRLFEAIQNAHAKAPGLALLFLDLDGFKRVNDSLGHGFGDLLLVEVGARLKRVVRCSDIVARLSGDEFVVIVQGVCDAASVARVAEEISEAIAQPFDIAGSELFVTTSIGIAIHPEDGQEPEELLKNADTALYRSKEIQRNSQQRYTRAMQQDAAERLRLASGLPQALQRGEFTLEYQPTECLRDGAITGVEALLRWESASEGRVTPERFIPLLEESGLILSVGRWVLETAMREALSWPASANPLRVGVNVSSRQFRDPAFPACIEWLLRETGLPPHALELEITERLLMENTDRVRKALKSVSDLGVTIALDDFGTGYSSLSYLQSFPIDVVKIDKSFVHGLASEANTGALVAAVVAMAGTLGMRTVAEGVETAAQRTKLMQIGCDEIQGYWLARPLASHELAAFLGSRYPSGRAVDYH